MYRTQFVKESWKQSLWYLYFFLVLFIAVENVPMALSLARAVPTVKVATQDFEEKAPNIFPNALVITVKNGVAKTNVREPFAITLPTQWMDALNASFPENPAFKSFLLLHTRARTEDFPLYRTVFLLTRNALVVLDHGKSFRVLSLNDVPSDLTLNAETYAKSLQRTSHFLALLPGLLYFGALASVLLLPFLKAVFLGLWYLLLLLPLTLLPFALAIHLGKHLSYAGLLRLGLHGLSLPIVLRTFELPVLGTHPPFSLAILYVLFMGVAVYQFPRWKPQNPFQNRANTLRKPKTPRTSGPLPPSPESV